jgi:ferredoxin
MIINKEACRSCGKCALECPKKAISQDSDGKFIIDPNYCVDCKDIMDVECVRVCVFRAITKNDGTAQEFDSTRRLMTAHLNYIIAVMGDRGYGHFPASTEKWAPFRKMIAAAYQDIDMKIRLSRHFDDMCIGCPSKSIPGHAEADAETSDAFFEVLGIEPGTVMRFWDAVRLAEEKYSMPFLKRITYPELIECYCRFVAPDSLVFDKTVKDER